MADASHLGTQFHEMTPDEFGAQPGTWWHGSANGMVGAHGGPFHVGTHAAATEALGAMIAGGNTGGRDAAVIKKAPFKAIRSSAGGTTYTSQPKVQPGRITASMSNTPHADPSRGPGNRFSYREGIPWGAMEDWQRRSSHEVMSDVRANAVVAGLHTSGRTMRRGMYYVNASEGAQDPEKDRTLPVSAIIPNRAGFKTHEDHVIEARARGKKIPDRVLQHYSHLGQGRLF